MKENSIFAAVMMGTSSQDGVGKNMTGTHFDVVPDPMNPKNKVLEIKTKNTNYKAVSSTVIGAEIESKNATTCELETKMFFSEMPWVFSPSYFDLVFHSESGAKRLSIRFEALEYGADTSNRTLVLKKETGEAINQISLLAGKWYRIKFEYYPADVNISESRLKIYIGEDNTTPTLVADVDCVGKNGSISKAVFLHHAFKIKGQMYLDDISFTITEKRYTEDDEYQEIPKSIRRVYDFEDGIPSSKKFNIQMKLNKDEKIFSFDPTITSASSSLLNSGEYYNIIHILDGKCELKSSEERYELSGGHIAVITPGCSLALTTDSEYKLLLISGSFEDLFSLEGISVIQDNIYGEGGKIAQLISYNRFSDPKYLSALCNAYIVFILMNMDKPPLQNTTAVVYNIIAEMEHRFNAPDVTVGKILQESGYAENYIRAKFGEVTGMSPNKYFTMVRMKHAKALLSQYGDTMSVGQIAEKCGIMDLNAFSRTFRKYYGISPTKYKNKSK